ncbi:MAG: DUF4373 domain-containing protein [Solobacterium sp.]|nr:DUF4373 domain-containing protein [Solobacterium sp.]
MFWSNGFLATAAAGPDRMTMARKGLKTFYIATQEDSKLQRLRARFPVVGKYVWIELLSKIYREEGYFLEWNDEVSEIFAGSISVHKDKVEKILRSCLELELFDPVQYKRNAVLTSAAIQRQYCSYYGRAKRVYMKSCFLCGNFDKSVYKNLILVTDSEENVTEMPLIKLNKMKCNIDDDKGEQVNIGRLCEKLAQPIERSKEMYNDNPERVDDTADILIRVIRAISDATVINSINSCNEKDAYHLWEKAMEIINPYQEAWYQTGIENKSGYLRKTIENYFGGLHGNHKRCPI